MKEIDFSKLIVLCSFLFIGTWTFGQVKKSGKITFNKRTNLEKRFEGSLMAKRIGKDGLKEPKNDKYVLYFDDSSSIFIPLEPEIGDEDREWATMKNTTYQNLATGELERQFSYFGANLYLSDSIDRRTWYITDNTREIAGYNTRQAVWEANDSTRIYAWYSEQLAPSVGPEGFNGLPGTILGLAIEDGGVVYFAEKVEELPAAKKDFRSMIPKGKSKEYYTREELLQFGEERFSSFGGSGRMIDDLIIW